MALPNTFANQPTAQMQWLDQNFAALGAISYVPCTAAGTNTITLTPVTNTPSISNYGQLQGYAFVATATNSGTVQLQVNSLTLLPVYKSTPAGPALLGGGDIQNTEYYVAIYDSALNASSGGFHLFNVAFGSTAQNANTVYAGPTSGAAASPSFRALIGSDLPLPTTTTVGGVMALNSSTSQFVIAIASSGQPQTAQVLFSNIGGTIAPIQIPAPTTTSLGGVFSLNSSLNQFVVAIAGSGQPQTAQVFFSNLGGSIGTPQFPATGVTAGTYGSANAFSQFTVDATGRISAASAFSASPATMYGNSVGAGRVLIGTSGSGFVISALSAGTNVTITSGDGTLTINASLGGGAVTGPGASTPGNLASFSGSAGTLLADSGVNYLNVAVKNASQMFSGGQRGSVVQLSGTNVVIDFSLSNNFAITMTSGTTMATAINVPPGQSGVIAYTQSSSGNCKIVYTGTNYVFAGTLSSSLTTTLNANALDYGTYYTNSSSSIYITHINNVGRA